MGSQPTICVIFNPHAGRGEGARRIRRVQRILGPHAVFRPTPHAGAGTGLARAAAEEGFALVAAAGGDGTVHEVANGLLRASRLATLAVLPLGSANDYAFSLGLQPEWWLRPDPQVGVRHVDVGVVKAPGLADRYFVNGVGVGFNGAVTLESRQIHSLRGVPLYLLALLRALWRRYHFPGLTLEIDGRATGPLPTLALTVALGQREGNFRLTPDAILDDGVFDYLHVGPLPRWRLLRYVPDMIRGTIPRSDPLIQLGRCQAMHLQGSTPLIVHTDGEFFCLPADEVTSLAIELLPGHLPVLGRLPG